MADAANIVGRAGIALGLRENWQQFALLVLINAFVGGMVGLERTLVPLIGSETFQLASTAAVTSFIVSFGIVKAVTNLVSGQLADGWGRKKTRDPVLPHMERTFTSVPRISLVVVQTSSEESPSQSAG